MEEMLKEAMELEEERLEIKVDGWSCECEYIWPFIATSEG